MLRVRVGTRQNGQVSKQITKKVQDQGQKHSVFDLAHGPSDVRCSVYGVVVGVGMCTCSRRLGRVSSLPRRLRVLIHTRDATRARKVTLAHWHNSLAQHKNIP